MDGTSMFTPVSFHPRKKMRSVLDWTQGYIIERGIMRVEALTLFLSVAQHRSISKAARQNFISQQGASAIIKNLESELGVSLFDRTPAGLQLTAAGCSIAQEAAKLVDSYRRLQMIASLEAIASADKELTIITMPFITNQLEALFSEYELLAGGIQLRIIERSLFDIIDHYAEDGSEALHLIALPTFMTGIAARITQDFQPLVPCELMVACNRTSPYADRAQFTRAELASTPLACYNEEFLNRLLAHLLGSQQPSIQMSTSNPAMIGRAVAGGALVTFTDSLSVFLGRSDTETVVVPIEDSVEFLVGVLGVVPAQGAAAQFMGFCQRYFATMCGPYLLQHGLTEENA